MLSQATAMFEMLVEARSRSEASSLCSRKAKGIGLMAGLHLLLTYSLLGYGAFMSRRQGYGIALPSAAHLRPTAFLRLAPC